MIAERQGLAMILGDNGMGKSTVLRYLLSEYSAEGYTARRSRLASIPGRAITMTSKARPTWVAESGYLPSLPSHTRQGILG